MKQFARKVSGTAALGLGAFAISSFTGLFAYGQFRRIRGLMKGYSAGRKVVA